jgi:hypothetical protein
VALRVRNRVKEYALPAVTEKLCHVPPAIGHLRGSFESSFSPLSADLKPRPPVNIEQPDPRFAPTFRMRFSFSHTRRKRLYWRAARFWGLIRLRRRIVVGAIVYCTLFGIGLALATPYIYKATVTLRVEKIPSDIGPFLSY